MDQGLVHFEVMVCRKAGASWSLELATEDRAKAVETAEQMIADGRAVAAKVTKETLDPDTREFKTVTILSHGAAEQVKTKAPKENMEPLCVSPQDLYTIHAREVIGRLLEPWLARNRATPFELLHRPDLVESLDAAGMDLQHAIQKVAVPESQARGVSVHEMIRSFQRLVEAAIERVLKDARKGVLPKLDPTTFAAVAEKLTGEAERHYLLGAGIASHIAGGASWREKVNRILDLADAAPRSPAARGLAFHVLEEPLAEILGSRAGMTELLGDRLDLGGSLAAMTRLAAADTVEALVSVEAAVAKMMPTLDGAAARLSNWLDGPYFPNVRSAIARRVLRELTGPRRLRPGDAEGEIAVLRALAMSLTAAAGRLLTLEEVQNAFADRSRMLMRSDFIEGYLGQDRSPLGDVEALLWLAENVTGAGNKRAASRWIAANVGALRFETEVLQGPDSAASKLAALAKLQRLVMRAGFVDEEAQPIAKIIGDLAGRVESEAKLISTIGKAASAPPLQRLTLLLRMAAGEAAPLGPAAEKAKVEVIKLMRNTDLRAELAKSPDSVDRLRGLMKTAGLAA